MSAPYAKAYGNTGAFLGTLDNAKVSYTLKDVPLNSAKLILPVDDAGNRLLAAYNRVELFDGGQRVGLFRVIGMPQSSIRAAGGTITYNLEDVLATLLDNIMPGYHEIGGTSRNMRQCIEYILNFQSTKRWKLGRCDFTTQFQYSFDKEYLLKALLSLPKQLTEEYHWTTDTTTTPWTLNLVRQSAAVECELRYRLNMLEIGKTFDAADLCTRAYAYGYGEGSNQLTVKSVNGGKLYIDSDTVNTWGVVEKPFVDTRFEQAQALLNRARQWLEGCKNPRISYTVKAVDLYRLTGDPWWQFYPGRLCRVNDQEHGVQVGVRVTQITRPDPYGKPGNVTVTLANRQQTVANEIADLASRASINELYAQGATNMYAEHFADNADATHPLRLRYWIDTDCVRINRVLLAWTLEAFRSYSRGTEAGGSATRTSTAGGRTQLTQAQRIVTVRNNTGGAVTGDGTVNKGATDDNASDDGGRTTDQYTGSTAGASVYTTTPASGNTGAEGGHTHNGNGHTHSFSGSDSVGYGHAHTLTGSTTQTAGIKDYSPLSVSISGSTGGSSASTSSAGGHSHTLGSHTHTMGHTHSVPHSHTIPEHHHGMAHFHWFNVDVTIPAISFQIDDHSHDVSFPAHRHDQEHGVFEGSAASGVTLKVDGTAVPASAIDGGELDIVPYMSKDDAGKITRGTWHSVEITPDGLTRIVADIFVKTFIRSQGGGDY